MRSAVTRTAAMTIAAVAGLTAGLAAPAASASPITDFINSISTGSTAPGSAAPGEGALSKLIRFRAGYGKNGLDDGPEYVVSRGSSPDDSCFALTSRNSGQGPRPVTNGTRVGPKTINTWQVDVDTASPRCQGNLETKVNFLNGENGTRAFFITASPDSIYVHCGTPAEGCRPDVGGLGPKVVVIT